MKSFLVVIGVITSLLFENVHAIAEETDSDSSSFKISLSPIDIYNLITADLYSINIDVPNKPNYHICRIFKRKIKINLVPNEDLGVKPLFEEFIDFPSVSVVFQVLNGYKVNIDKERIKVRARRKMKKTTKYDFKVDVDESKVRTLDYPYQSSNFTQILIPLKTPEQELQTFTNWMDDVLNHFRVRYFNVGDLNDGVISDKNIIKIVDLKTRTEFLLPHSKQFLNFKPNLTKFFSSFITNMKERWNKFALKYQIYFMVLLDLGNESFRRNILFGDVLTKNNSLEPVNLNSLKYIEKLEHDKVSNNSDLN